MNVLYIYRESKWGKELKYSLRSVDKYVNPDTVYVVGDEVEFKVDNIIIPRKEGRQNDACNIIKEAVNTIQGDLLLLMHDDHFLLQPYTPEIKYNGTLHNRAKRTGGERRVMFDNTLEHFEEAKNYDLHYPLPFNRKLMKQIFNHIESPFSYMSAYGNLDNDFVHLESDDCKFSAPSINNKLLSGLPSFSTYNEDDPFENFLKSLYPKPSQYE